MPEPRLLCASPALYGPFRASPRLTKLVTWSHPSPSLPSGSVPMAETLARTAQLHVRLLPEMKRAVKVHCAQVGTTEQAWVEHLIEAELRKQAPELLPPRQHAASRCPPKGTR